MHSNLSRNIHKYICHERWHGAKCMVSRWPPLPCLDEYRKCPPCRAEAGDPLFETKVISPCFLLFVFISPGHLKRSCHVWQPSLISGVKGEKEEGEKMLVFVFTVFFHKQTGNEGRICLHPYIAWKGHKVMGGGYWNGNSLTFWFSLLHVVKKGTFLVGKRITSAQISLFGKRS